MRTIQWYFDVISPFSYLQLENFDRLPNDVNIEFKPILFAGLLKHWEHKGPAEIPEKRIFTYRYVNWLAKRLAISFKFPPQHPFNPLKALRLATAFDDIESTRKIFDYIWKDGNSLDDPEKWQELLEHLGHPNAEKEIAKQSVKNKLIQNGEDAIKQGVFGVPTTIVDEQLFWGFDATEFIIDYLENPALFDDDDMKRVSDLPVGQARTIKEKDS